MFSYCVPDFTYIAENLRKRNQIFLGLYIFDEN